MGTAAPTFDQTSCKRRLRSWLAELDVEHNAGPWLAELQWEVEPPWRPGERCIVTVVRIEVKRRYPIR